ncbi:hypothetical protein [Clostridium scatologenes]|uniref:Uncharacterized protein n=1 Tax=Clostridium scatologenes TaxID=1548 RepID=A0A0E3GS70_CLOSL|nr:hypothetical protein [Clostridium scatologenes]AKA71556.1 hypothetical protein CSCA_4431 [Clostridium scatologenes]
MKNNENETRLNKKKYKYKLIYYVIGYVIGYIISLCVSGVPSLIYLIPIKIDALVIGAIIGTLWNTHHYSITGNDARSYALLPAVILIIFIAITASISTVLFNCGIITNHDPFAGMFETLSQTNGK